MSLPADVTEAERRALVQAAVFVRNDLGNSTGENADGRRLVTNLFRRMLGRGTMPPVDPLIETHILESVGLGAEARAAAHPGDLARTIDQKKIPSVETVRAALRHRHEFVPDSRLKRYDGSPVLSEPAMQFFQRELAGLSASAGQWCHPGRVGPGTTLDAMDLDSVLLETPDISAVLTQREPESRVRTLGRMEAFIRAGGTADEYTMKLVWAPIAAHRIALGVAEAAERGWLNGERWTFVIDEPTGIASVALQSAVEVLGAISSIWNVPMLPQEVRLIVGNQANVWRAEAEGRFVPAAVQEAIDPHDAVTLRIELFRGPYHELPADAGPCVVIRSTCLPVQLIDDRPLGASRARVDSAASVPRWALVRLLRAVFAKADFQPDGPHPRGQEAAIRRLLAGDDTVVLLPTGAGKSLIYQFAGLLLPGLTLVVDPIVALIDDQVDGLNRQGIDRALGITSADRVEGSADAKLKRIAAGEALFAFVAPERLQQRRFRETLRTMTATTPIALVVVDEAHCVSEWGHDFRTSYLDIGRVLRHVAADVEGLSPPLLALTGTASRAVLKDMLIELGVDRADPGIVISPASFDRSELRFAVVHADDDEPLARLIGTVRGLPSRFRESGVPRALGEFLRPRGAATASGVIFCQTVDGRYGVKRTAKLLEANLNIEVATYSGKPDGGAGAKRNNARRFKENEAPLMVATKAYGMGVDKPNIRYAIHVGIPSSIENYYQEIGRAGRDRRESACILVHFPDARNTLDYFHQKTYAGVESEVASLAGVIAALPELGELRECIIPFHDDGAASRERAIHRLKLLGIVRDYTVDWAGSRFEVKTRPCAPADVDLALAAFVRRNQPGRVAEFERRMAADAPAALQPRVLSRGRMMIDYVYETIVAARRRAVDEMERLAEQGTTEQLIRDRILRYLELGKVASAVEALIDAEPFEFEPWIALLDDLETMDDAREWRGATARLLESDPDNPGLLLGRGLAEASAEGDVELFKRSLAHALDTASRKYSVSHRSIARTVAWAAHWLGRRAPTLRPLIYGIVDTALPGTSDELLDPLELQALGSANIERAELSIVLDRRLRKVADYAKTAANRLTITPS
jgi:ATP-dependent DNA helicase RecQ